MAFYTVRINFRSISCYFVKCHIIKLKLKEAHAIAEVVVEICTKDTRFCNVTSSRLYPEIGSNKFAETLLPVYHTALCHFLEDPNLRLHVGCTDTEVDMDKSDVVSYLVLMFRLIKMAGHRI